MKENDELHMLMGVQKLTDLKLSSPLDTSKHVGEVEAKWLNQVLTEVLTGQSISWFMKKVKPSLIRISSTFVSGLATTSRDGSVHNQE